MKLHEIRARYLVVIGDNPDDYLAMLRERKASDYLQLVTLAEFARMRTGVENILNPIAVMHALMPINIGLVASTQTVDELKQGLDEAAAEILPDLMDIVDDEVADIGIIRVFGAEQNFYVPLLKKGMANEADNFVKMHQFEGWHRLERGEAPFLVKSGKTRMMGEGTLVQLHPASTDLRSWIKWRDTVGEDVADKADFVTLFGNNVLSIEEQSGPGSKFTVYRRHDDTPAAKIVSINGITILEAGEF